MAKRHNNQDINSMKPEIFQHSLDTQKCKDLTEAADTISPPPLVASRLSLNGDKTNHQAK